DPPTTNAERIATDKWTQITFNVFVYFIPMIFCFFFAGRPLRFSVAMAGLLLGNLYFAHKESPYDFVLESRRTYFGVLRVKQAAGIRSDDRVRDENEIQMFRQSPLQDEEGKQIAPYYPYTYLMHGTTYH